jgi:hypothetical protein
MIAVIVANPTPADNEGGKILRLENFVMRNFRNLSHQCFYFLFSGVASARDQRQRKLYFLVKTS